MAAYAAVISLMNTIDHIQNHPRFSTFLDQKQIQSLQKIIDILLYFIESYNSGGGSKVDEVLESRIASAAHVAEDVIESHVVDQIHAGSMGETSWSSLLDLEAVNKDMNSVKETVLKFQETEEFRDLQTPCSAPSTSSNAKNVMVGFDDELIQIMERLTGHQLDLLIVPIVGMGGIGKTTLARNVYENSRIVEHFAIRAWVTVTQDYDVNEILYELLCCVGAFDSEIGLETEDLLRVKLSKVLWDRREAFLGEGCPPELEKIGKNIVRECQGLPLSIFVIGGLLRKSKRTQKSWENFAKDLNSTLMKGNDEHCMKILSLSYNHLSPHLKPCFLYMGVFHQNISVSRLIKLFVVEGFLKPKTSQSSEEVAEEYIKDLVDRNLIIVESWKQNGRIKHCKMHDLVREVCLKIGEGEKFFHGMRKGDIPPGIESERRIAFFGRPSRKNVRQQVFGALPLAPLARTYKSKCGPLPFKFRLMRVLTCVEYESLEVIFQQVNLRYLAYLPREDVLSKIPSSVSQLWNLQTFIVGGASRQVTAPSEMWYMRQLKHVKANSIVLPDPPPPSDKLEQHDDVLLPNLLTLSKVVNFSFTEEVCKRIPNIEKLRLSYEECQKKCYINLEILHKLQSLSCFFKEAPKRGDLLQSLVFPSSLKKLTLKNCQLHWEDINKMGLSLPHLQALKLKENAVVGRSWDSVEGAFPRLKFLQISRVDLRKWTTENSECFPLLERLHLQHLKKLEVIPSGMREAYTLQHLHVYKCSESAAISSAEILEEQLIYGNEGLKLELMLMNKSKKRFGERVDTDIFTSKNFQLNTL